jgi:peptidoglycan/xylan/chitin deacetylase (PgdA/CDA1 family)
VKLPVLLYHQFGEPESRYCESPERLREQMAWLNENSFQSITPSDLHGALDTGPSLPARPIMITFDDANVSDLVFQEILAEFGFRGTYFWPNNTPMTRDQLASIARSGEVCGHTVNHPNLAKLIYSEQMAEIASNRAWIEHMTGRQAIGFGYPFGAYSDETPKILADAGFLFGFDAEGPIVEITRLDRWHIARQIIPGGIDLTSFIETLNAGESSPR